MAKEKEIVESKFLNPFSEGVSYKAFIAELDKSKKTIEDYCKNKLTDEQIEFLKTEIKLIK